MSPFLKWPGGKRWFVAKHRHLLPETFNRYIEPFLGSGAVFFSLQPKRAILSDLNEDVITIYRGIKRDWVALQRLLKMHGASHGKRYYYRVRGSEPAGLIERAARLIYLNRTCFNGIYRVNSRGHFNVPKGTKQKVLLANDDFGAVAKLLGRAQIRHASDFEPTVEEAARGDLLFIDPPYTVRHNNNAFIKYNEDLFSWDDQVRLARALDRARRRGAKVVATNANHHSVRELYHDAGFVLQTVSRFSSISAATESRKQFEELVITGNVNGASR